MTDPLTKTYFDLFLGPVLPDRSGPSSARAFLNFPERSFSNSKNQPRLKPSYQPPNNHSKTVHKIRPQTPIVISDSESISESDSSDERGKNALKTSRLSGHIDTGPCQMKALFSKKVSGRKNAAKPNREKNSSRITNPLSLVAPPMVPIQSTSDLEQFFLSNIEETFPKRLKDSLKQTTEVVEQGVSCEVDDINVSLKSAAEVLPSPRQVSPSRDIINMDQSHLSPRSHKKSPQQRSSSKRQPENKLLKNKKQKLSIPPSEKKRQVIRSNMERDVTTAGARQKINFQKTQDSSRQSRPRVSQRIKNIQAQNSSTQESETRTTSPSSRTRRPKKKNTSFQKSDTELPSPCRNIKHPEKQRHSSQASEPRGTSHVRSHKSRNEKKCKGGHKSKPPRVYSPGPSAAKSTTLSRKNTSVKHKLPQHSSGGSKAKRPRLDSHPGKSSKTLTSQRLKGSSKSPKNKKSGPKTKTLKTAANAKSTRTLKTLSKAKNTNKNAKKTRTKKVGCKKLTPERLVEKAGPRGSIFTLSELEHASNSLVPVTDLLTLEERLHAEPNRPAHQARPAPKASATHCRLGVIFDSRLHPGGIWKSIVDEG